jgi:plasmid stabilization system protein ParE
MAKRKIAWTNTAAKQRREILRYWTEKNQRRDYAEKLIEITAKHLNIIARNPEAFKETDFHNVRESARGFLVFIIKLRKTKCS